MTKLIKSVAISFVLLASLSVHAEWTKQQTNSFAWYKDVFFLNERNGWIVGTDGVYMSTDDGGVTWTQAKKFTSDSILQVHFTSADRGWLLCERNVFNRSGEPTSYLRRTTDGGRTWERVEFEHAGRERVTKLFFGKDGSAGAFGEGGIFYKLDEDGVTWKKALTAIHYLLLDAAYATDRIGAIVGSGGTILFTEDSGYTWQKATLLGDRDVRFNAVYFYGNSGGWAVGTRGRIFYNNGGGRLWRQQESGVTANLNDVYFTNATSGWAVGDAGIMVRTRDGGRNWNDVPLRITHKLEKITFAGKRGWAVGFGGTILTYSDGPSDSGTRPFLMRRG